MIKNIKTLYLELTKKCNINCQYCYNSINETIESDLDNRITLIGAFVYKFKDIIDDNLNVCLHGGEVLLLPLKKIYTLINIIQQIKPNASFNIQTNGILLANKEIQDFLDSIDNKVLTISFDSNCKNVRALSEESKKYIKRKADICVGGYLIDGVEDYDNLYLINEVQSLFKRPIQLMYNFFKTEDLPNNYKTLNKILNELKINKPENFVFDILYPHTCGEITITYDGKVKSCDNKLHGVSKEDLEHSKKYLETLDCQNCKFYKNCLKCGNRMANFRNNLCYFIKAVHG